MRKTAIYVSPAEQACHSIDIPLDPSYNEETLDIFEILILLGDIFRWMS